MEEMGVLVFGRRSGIHFTEEEVKVQSGVRSKEEDQWKTRDERSRKKTGVERKGSGEHERIKDSRRRGEGGRAGVVWHS